MNKKLVLINLGAAGDIINTTPIAKYYKLKKNREVIYLTLKKYKYILEGNPFIDKINIIDHLLEKIPFLNKTFDYNLQASKILQNTLKINEEIIFCAPYMSNKYDGSPKENLLDFIKDTSKIENWEDINFIPIIYPSEEDKKSAINFYNQLSKDSIKILLEYEFSSEQSPYNEKYFYKICEVLENKGIFVEFILSGMKKPSYVDNIKYKNIKTYHYAESMKSNIELYNLCHLFIGVSSGISCITHSEKCKDLPRLEIVRGEHWSTSTWKHMTKKIIINDIEQIEESLNFLLNLIE